MKSDLIIIGAGPGGYEAAIRAAQGGLSVILFEAREAGGTCLNRGCVPAKALLHAAALARGAREGEQWGISMPAPQIDLQKTIARKDEIVSNLRGGIETLLKQNGVQLIHARARLVKPGVVEAEGESYEAPHIILATGGKPALPPVPGLNLPGVMTSDEILDMTALPARLAILGGGVIGVEMAEIYSSLGVEVTIIEALDRLLPLMEREIGQTLSMRLKKRGISILTGARLEKVTEENGMLCCHVGEQTVLCDKLLVAVGRVPQTEGLFAEGASPEMEGRRVKVDARYRSSLPGAYAIGDLSSPVQLAHVASAQGIACVDMILGKESETAQALIPSCVYTSPEIACVGLTETEAKALSGVKTGKFLMSANARTQIAGGERGYIKLVCDENDLILGAQMICENATDMIDEITQAIANHMTARDLLRGMRPHPTFIEGLTEALEALDGRAIHMAPPRRK